MANTDFDAVAGSLNNNIVKLWTNQNPTASFANQTVSVDMRNYEGCLVITSGNVSSIAVFSVNKALFFSRVDGLGGSGCWWTSRTATINDELTSINFSNGSYTYRDGGSGGANTSLIPLAIFGIKRIG